MRPEPQPLSDPRALEERLNMERVEGRRDRAQRSALSGGTPLPDVDGKGLEFLWISRRLTGSHGR